MTKKWNQISSARIPSSPFLLIGDPRLTELSNPITYLLGWLRIYCMATAECKRPLQLKTLKSEDLFGGMIFACFGQLSMIVLSALPAPVVLSALPVVLSLSCPCCLSALPVVLSTLPVVLSALPVVLSALPAFLSVSSPWLFVSLRQNYTELKETMPKLHSAKTDYAKITQC